MLEWFERRGQIVKDPKPGDIVFFKYPTNTRRTNHVGIVVAASGRVINTIEGNTSVTNQDNGGCVMQRNRTSNIVAYARPNYDGLAKPVEKEGRETLRVGSKGNDVLYLHKQLKKLGYGVDPNSNYFDSTTKMCVLNFQAAHPPLEVDGVVGKNTWKEIDKV
jgi:peptidoglycan hydrolase-like protein with peptidoglycan-binding domain